MKKLIFSVTLLMYSAVTQASVINSGNVTIDGNSYGTFIDETTGLTWLDIDSFWDRYSTYNSITTLLTSTDFHLATLKELQTLQASIPVTPDNFDSEVLIVGGNYYGNPHPGWDREMIDGIYDDGDNSMISLSYRWGDTDWLYSANRLGPDDNIFRINGAHQDTGAWIVSNQVLVPIPASIWLFISGIAGLVGAKIKSHNKALHQLILWVSITCDHMMRPDLSFRK